MKKRNEELQKIYDVLVSALGKCTHHKFSIDEKRTLASEALLSNGFDLNNGVCDDKEIMIGSLALHNIIFGKTLTQDIDANIAAFKTVNENAQVGDLARLALRKMMPNWAYEQGIKSFEGVPDELVELLEQLEDVSWHNEPIPRFEFAKDSKGLIYGISAGYCYEENPQGEFIFDVYFFDETSNPESIQNDDFLEEIKLPSNCGCYGDKGEVTDADFSVMIDFIKNFALSEKKDAFLAIAAKYDSETEE